MTACLRKHSGAGKTDTGGLQPVTLLASDTNNLNIFTIMQNYFHFWTMHVRFTWASGQKPYVINTILDMNVATSLPEDEQNKGG